MFAPKYFKKLATYEKISDALLLMNSIKVYFGEKEHFPLFFIFENSSIFILKSHMSSGIPFQLADIIQ